LIRITSAEFGLLGYPGEFDSDYIPNKAKDVYDLSESVYKKEFDKLDSLGLDCIEQDRNILSLKALVISTDIYYKCRNPNIIVLYEHYSSHSRSTASTVISHHAPEVVYGNWRRPQST
jgi:hypothetical protein